MLFKILCALSVVLVSVQNTAGATDKVICYHASWAVYRNGNGAFKPQNIDPDLCSHVYYAFLGVNPDGTLKMLDSWNEINLGGLAGVRDLKEVNPNLKVLISIGGWNAGNAILNGIAASSKLRGNLINSCIEFFENWGYDGLDIAWEYPGTSDKANFVKLLKEMRAVFDENGYVLSVAVAATPLASYDVPEISNVVDVINVMTYDFHSTTEGLTGLNAPLYGPLSVNASIFKWLGEGADPAKLTIGVPFYGHSYSLRDESQNHVGSPAIVGIGGPYTQSPGVLGYNEICEFYDDWTRVWDVDAQVPYRYDGANWVSYEDEMSLGLKAKYAKENGLAGVMVWSVDTDDFHGTCGIQHILLQAISNNLV